MRRIARFVALGYFAIVVVAAALQAVGVAQFAAPLNVIPAPVRPTITVNILYSPEQRQWLAAAVQQFAATGPKLRGSPIQIVLREQGSQAIVDGIVQGRSQPTAIIPAGSNQIDALRRAQAGTIATSGANAPQPVALSPLVLVGWKDRVDALFPQGGQEIWQRLHDTQAKFGHASPLKSNSGVEALTLLAYAYYHKNQGLTIDDVKNPDFQKWLGEIEAGIVDRPFYDSTDDLFNAFLSKGRSAYDVVVVYESQAIERLRSGDLRLLYPPATTLSDHPFAVLEAPWVKPEEQEAARLFRDFLLSEPSQRLARQYGFRPAIANITLQDNDSSNPFPSAFNTGVQQNLPGTVAQPPQEVLEALSSAWQQASR